MATHTGTQYKPQEELGSKEDHTSLEKMMAQFIKDLRKHEEEIAAKYAQHWTEICSKTKEERRGT